MMGLALGPLREYSTDCPPPSEFGASLIPLCHLGFRSHKAGFLVGGSN
jgi:hypothetical protein